MRHDCGSQWGLLESKKRQREEDEDDKKGKKKERKSLNISKNIAFNP